MSEKSHDIKSEIKIYYYVFGALIFFSALTVGVSYIHFGLIIGITVALLIALVKGSLVASHFMHLKSEKKLVYFVLIMTVIFFLSMMTLFIASFYDVPEGLKFLDKEKGKTIKQQLPNHHEEKKH